MNPKISQLIKVTSIVLITAALGLEIWSIYLQLNNETIPTNLNLIWWVGTIALIAHGIEGIVAAFNAGSRGQNPITYGIYTFFVGFIGLQELFERSPKIQD